MTRDELELVLDKQYWNLEGFETTPTGIKIAISSYSNAGESLYELIDIETGKTFTDAFFEWADNYDPEEHAKMWVNCDAPGVPSLFTLVEDAKDIGVMFWDLAYAIRDAEKEYV